MPCRPSLTDISEKGPLLSCHLFFSFLSIAGIFKTELVSLIAYQYLLWLIHLFISLGMGRGSCMGTSWWMWWCIPQCVPWSEWFIFLTLCPLSGTFFKGVLLLALHSTFWSPDFSHYFRYSETWLSSQSQWRSLELRATSRLVIHVFHSLCFLHCC